MSHKKNNLTANLNFNTSFQKGVLQDFDNFKNVCWIRNGIYASFFKNWMKFFELKQFLILDGENFIQDPFIEIKKMEKFLNLRPFIQREHFVFDHKKGFYCINKDSNQKTQECMDSSKGREHPFVSQTAIQKLNNYYKPFNVDFFKLINQKPFWSV